MSVIWAESSVLMWEDIVESLMTPALTCVLYIYIYIYNFGIISASLFGKCCDLLRLTCMFFADSAYYSGNLGVVYLILVLFD